MLSQKLRGSYYYQLGLEEDSRARLQVLPCFKSVALKRVAEMGHSSVVSSSLGQSSHVVLPLGLLIDREHPLPSQGLGLKTRWCGPFRTRFSLLSTSH